jgi:hypothetical protein
MALGGYIIRQEQVADAVADLDFTPYARARMHRRRILRLPFTRWSKMRIGLLKERTDAPNTSVNGAAYASSSSPWEEEIHASSST